MKKFLVLFLTLALMFTFVACNTPDAGKESSTPASTPAATPESTPSESNPNTNPEGPKALTYAEFMAAEVGTEVTVEAYVQACRGWWDNKITIYAQTEEGGYFFYDITCSEEDAAKLVKGTKVRVTGPKAEYAGEIEVMGSTEAPATLEILEGDTWVAEAADLTDLLGTDELINKMNTYAAFKGLTVKEISYKNGEPGDDISVFLTKGDVEVEFYVEVYLTGTETDVYTTVGTLEVGDVVDVEAFLYWYNGANPHIVGITVAE